WPDDLVRSRRWWRRPQDNSRRRCPDRALRSWTGDRPPGKFAHDSMAYDARGKFRTADPHRQCSAVIDPVSLAGRDSLRRADAGFVESARLVVQSAGIAGHGYGSRHAPPGERIERLSYSRLDARWADRRHPARPALHDLEVHAREQMISAQTSLDS